MSAVSSTGCSGKNAAGVAAGTAMGGNLAGLGGRAMAQNLESQAALSSDGQSVTLRSSSSRPGRWTLGNQPGVVSGPDGHVIHPLFLVAKETVLHRGDMTVKERHVHSLGMACDRTRIARAV